MIKRPTRRTPPGQLPGQLKEVLFEFQRHGNIMRVVAIDPVTRVEVTMIADPRHSQESIKKLAARKLAYVLAKKQAKDQPQKKDPYKYL